MKTIVRVYVIVSLALSLAFHLTGDYTIVRHRFPFIVLEMANVTADSAVHGHDHHGYYVGLRNAQPGDAVNVLMLYNPLNNYSNDIIARFDF
jgi:hypothetical protein